MDLRKIGCHDLYHLWAESMAVLKERGMWANGSPLGWYAEQLACDRLCLDPTPVNTHYHDAIGTRDLERYQIKGRTSSVSAANINGLQDLPGKHFHFLVVVLFEEDRCSMRQAFKIHHSAVLEVAKLPDSGRNGWQFPLTAVTDGREGVEDITELLS